MKVIRITDLDLPELQIYSQLSESQLYHYYEPQEGIFIAESPMIIQRALDAGYEPLSVLVEDKWLRNPGTGADSAQTVEKQDGICSESSLQARGVEYRGNALDSARTVENHGGICSEHPLQAGNVGNEGNALDPARTVDVQDAICSENSSQARGAEYGENTAGSAKEIKPQDGLHANELLLQMGNDIPIYAGPLDVLTSITGYALTRGILCAMRRKPLPKPEELLQLSCGDTQATDNSASLQSYRAEQGKQSRYTQDLISQCVQSQIGRHAENQVAQHPKAKNVQHTEFEIAQRLRIQSVQYTEHQGTQHLKVPSIQRRETEVTQHPKALSVQHIGNKVVQHSETQSVQHTETQVTQHSEAQSVQHIEGKNIRRTPSEVTRVVILDQVMNPTNVGSIFRSAAALGMDCVLLTKGCADPLSRRAARVSMGTVFQIPWTFLEAWPEDMAMLRAGGFQLAAMALEENSIALQDYLPKPEEKIALIMGTEGYGLPQETIRACDLTLQISMAHGVDSLNVAAASAVAFWHLRNHSYPLPEFV